jgi:hypothetical protein
MDQDAFHQMWGTGGTAPAAPDDDSGTRSLDLKAFENQWLTPAPAEPAAPGKGVMPYPTAAALASGYIEGFPIVGPYIKSGVEKAAAKARSLRDGTSYQDELDFVRRSNALNSQDHSIADTTGQLTSSVGSMLTGAGMAPRAFGLVGPLAERMGFGAATNALIGGADAAARSGGDLSQTGQGAALGGVLGGTLPAAGRVAGAVGNKVFGSADTAVNALAQKAAAMGIPIRFAQTSDSPFVQKLSQMAGRLPGSGMGELHAQQQAGFNRAVANTFGENADRITPDVMAAAKKRIGGDFDSVAKNSTIQFDSHLNGDLHSILHEAGSTLADSELKILNKQVGNVLDRVTGAGEIEGPTYQALTRHGAPLDRAMNSSDPNVRHYAGRIKEALDDALERSAPPDQIDKLRKARGQYKAMKTIEDLVEKSPTGDISPALLMNPVRQSYGNMAYGGGGDLADLARVGQRFMRQPPDSGTPLGTAALNLLLGAGGAGVAGYSTGYDPISMLKGAALLPATALAARGATTLLNRPQAVNNLLQRAPALLPAYNQLTQH